MFPLLWALFIHGSLEPDRDAALIGLSGMLLWSTALGPKGPVERWTSRRDAGAGGPAKLLDSMKTGD